MFLFAAAQRFQLAQRQLELAAALVQLVQLLLGKLAHFELDHAAWQRQHLLQRGHGLVQAAGALQQRRLDQVGIALQGVKVAAGQRRAQRGQGTGALLVFPQINIGFGQIGVQHRPLVAVIVMRHAVPGLAVVA